MKLEVQKIDIKSVVLSALPLTIFFIAVIGGLITFFALDNPQYATMTPMHKIISVAIYALVYVIMSSALIVFACFLYNFLGAVLGLRGITLDLVDSGEFIDPEANEDSEESEEESDEQ